MGRPEFDFEQALTRWRARLTQNQELKAGEIEELEDHLREVYREELARAILLERLFDEQSGAWVRPLFWKTPFEPKSRGNYLGGSP